MHRVQKVMVSLQFRLVLSSYTHASAPLTRRLSKDGMTLKSDIVFWVIGEERQGASALTLRVQALTPSFYEQYNQGGALRVPLVTCESHLSYYFALSS
ncbi:hypothetical protein BDN71DRAFT_820670 [Pleurotus eryngii]|uniref:Uncharacterized protein n=1 Tax=Pleurotus eryngii TaxID=5323 RepID=A0A9P6D8N3_PLEER|nr:hypothetical protein BDN71DRAFT_820670 [Pleurotus eryngii]